AVIAGGNRGAAAPSRKLDARDRRSGRRADDGEAPGSRSHRPSQDRNVFDAQFLPADRRARPVSRPRSGARSPGRGRRRRTLTPMAAEVTLTAAFSTVPAGEAEEIKRVIVDTVRQLAQDDGTFTRAKLVFTESDERCGLTAELDGVKREGVPLQLDLEQLEDAKTSAGARAQLKEALRLYFRKVLGK